MAAAPARSKLGDSRPTGTVRVTVVRSEPTARRDFDVPTLPTMVLIDVLASVQRDSDPSLAFRYSCRAGRCGTCTVRLNGAPVLACQTRVQDGDELILEPLGGLPVVHDLVVDTGPFFARWKEALRVGTPHVAAHPSNRAAEAARDCIACGACFAACPVASATAGFWGPAALSRIAADQASEESLRLRTVGPQGVGGCHSVGACSIVCPRGLDPAMVIRSLRGPRRGIA